MIIEIIGIKTDMFLHFIVVQRRPNQLKIQLNESVVRWLNPNMEFSISW